MCNRLVIIGAGGHGKVVADTALKNGYTDIVFVDDGSEGTCLRFPIVGTTRELMELNTPGTDFIIAVGDNDARKRIAESYDLPWVTLVHPSAQIGTWAKVGVGTVVLECAKLNACSTVGDHCIINSGGLVGHDCVVEDYVHVSANASLGGTTRVGERTFVGLGSTLRNNIDVCPGCLIGAGAVVVKNITEPGVYVGNPARWLKG